MSRWSLKVKVGLYCAFLTALALVAAAAIILPFMYHQQVNALDQDLASDCERLIDDLKTRLAGPIPANGTVPAPFDFQRPIKTKDIPPNWQRRYLCINGPHGEDLYRSRGNLKDVDIRHLPVGFHTTQLFGKDCRIAVIQRGPATVWMGTRLGTIDDMHAKLIESFGKVIPIITILVFVGGMLLARHALNPVSAMTAAAERISAQSPDERLPVPRSRDEIARLTLVLNESFDRLQRAYNSAARFSADASHQLKTPIAVLRAGLDELRMCNYLEPQDRETVDTLLAQTRRLTTLVEDLLLLAQADAGRLRMEATPLNLAPLLAVVLDDTEAIGAERELVITLNAPPVLFAKADPRRVKIILQNLTENAVRYNREGGKIRINAQREGEWVMIGVANTGAAIPEQYRERLFERFNRAGMGENIKGHGLGLNIARELARAHGGDLTLVRSDGEWTEFALRIPASEAPIMALAPEMQGAAA